MLPTPGELPSAASQWCYQVGFGGSRTIVRVQGGRVTLLDAEGSGLAARTELAGLGAALGSTEALFDGEIDGTPPGLWITDLLHLDGRDTTVLPYTRRRALLEELPLTGPAWRLAPSYDEGGSVVASAAREQGLPVVVAKRAGSHYLPGEVTDQWIEYRTAQRSGTSEPETGQPGPALSSPTQSNPAQSNPAQSSPARAATGRSRGSARTTSVEVGDRRVRLANPDKVLYPATGMRKRDVLEYYLAVAPVLLPHVAARPVTLRRWPDGVSSPSFFEKNVSRHVPDWVRTVRLATPGSSSGSDSLDYPLLDTAATVAWAANLAALELHVPQWRVDGDGQRGLPDLLVFDLDPGEDTTIVECARVALLIAELLEADGLAVYPRTSGGKGMQLYSPVQVSGPEQTGRYAKGIAESLAGAHPRAVTAVMAKNRRRGKVFIDWSQNNPAKTTVASYSLRGREYPTVATPVTWPEVRRCERPEDLRFLAGDLRDRLSEHGDLLAPLLSTGQPLPDAPS
jgi:bifunctional non-homologous end joining protein LigD